MKFIGELTCSGFRMMQPRTQTDTGRQGTMKIVAYGSLMSRSSLESVVHRPSSLSKIIIPGWKRVFNAPFDGYAFLNLQPTSGGKIEAVYFEIDPAELQLFSVREAGAELVEIVPGFYAFVWPAEYCRELPALRSYIDICSDAARELGINFTVGLDWPRTVVDDTKNPEYRLICLGSHERFPGLGDRRLGCRSHCDGVRLPSVASGT
jgi:hypothetical protein